MVLFWDKAWLWSSFWEVISESLECHVWQVFVCLGLLGQIKSYHSMIWVGRFGPWSISLTFREAGDWDQTLCLHDGAPTKTLGIKAYVSFPSWRLAIHIVWHQWQESNALHNSTRKGLLEAQCLELSWTLTYMPVPWLILMCVPQL